jgi:hypothetical protein
VLHLRDERYRRGRQGSHRAQGLGQPRAGGDLTVAPERPAVLDVEQLQAGDDGDLAGAIPHRQTARFPFVDSNEPAGQGARERNVLVIPEDAPNISIQRESGAGLHADASGLCPHAGIPVPHRNLGALSAGLLHLQLPGTDSVADVVRARVGQRGQLAC